jgi:deoxyribodipyrimidine photo-lyase
VDVAGRHLRQYFDVRNGMLGEGYSSKLSPFISTGCLSARTVHAECQRYERARVKNKSTYWLVFELMFRDFYILQSMKYGNSIFKLYGPKGAKSRKGGASARSKFRWTHDDRRVEQKPAKPEFGTPKWPGTEQQLERWKVGQTGWPLVDANMREVNATGFMSNRGRQNVASFLINELKVDWRQGADWFEVNLIDHDVSINYGNWCSAAGLFGGRINRFNITKQSHDYDPQGDYVRHWLPELRRVRGAKVHTPWLLSSAELRDYGVELGTTYPHPLPSLYGPQDGSRGGKRGGRNRKRYGHEGAGSNGAGGRGGGNDNPRQQQQVRPRQARSRRSRVQDSHMAVAQSRFVSVQHNMRGEGNVDSRQFPENRGNRGWSRGGGRYRGPPGIF